MVTDSINFFQNKIAFINYPTTNLKVTTEFYQNILGLQLLLRTEDWVEFKIGNQRLAFNRVSPPLQDTPHNGAIVWLETSSIEQTVEALKNKGIRIVKATQDFSYGKLAQFEDPTANILGLYEPSSKKK